MTTHVEHESSRVWLELRCFHHGLARNLTVHSKRGSIEILASGQHAGDPVMYVMIRSLGTSCHQGSDMNSQVQTLSPTSSLTPKRWRGFGPGFELEP